MGSFTLPAIWLGRLVVLAVNALTPDLDLRLILTA